MLIFCFSDNNVPQGTLIEKIKKVINREGDKSTNTWTYHYILANIK